MAAKHKLLAKNRKLFKTVDIDAGNGERVPVEIRKPSMGDRLRLLEKAREAGDMDAEHKPTSERAGARVLARIAVCVLFDPETKRPLFADNDLDELLDEAWLEELAGDLGAVFNVSEEQMRGNSPATPS